MKQRKILLCSTALIITTLTSRCMQQVNQSMRIKEAFNPQNTIVLFQKQACILPKNSSSPYKKLFTCNLNPCIGIALDDKKQIGLIHVDCDIDFESIASFIAQHFSSDDTYPLSIWLAAAHNVSADIWADALKAQGSRNGFNSQRERIEVLKKSILNAFDANKQHPPAITTWYAKKCCFDVQELDHRNTLGISNKGPFQVKMYGREQEKTHKQTIVDNNVSLLKKLLDEKMSDEALVAFYQQQCIALNASWKRYRLFWSYPVTKLDIVNIATIELVRKIMIF